MNQSRERYSFAPQYFYVDSYKNANSAINMLYHIWLLIRIASALVLPNLYQPFVQSGLF